MRERLLEATFESLYELGYAATTTTEVCRRGGLSRGAMLHHYPTKTDLVAAAAEYVFQKRLDEFRAAIGELPETASRAAPAIDLLWQILSGETYYAWLELVVASRTDAQLRAKIRAVMERFGDDVQKTFLDMFPAPAFEMIDHSVTPGFVFALLNGLAIDRIYADDESVHGVVNALKQLAVALENIASNRSDNN
jgi:AcrR family transcriptional regulator